MEKGNSPYPEEIRKLMEDTELFGRMNDPSASSFLKGPCGDSMEFYLTVEKGRISGVKYHTEGCSETRACAAMAAHLALGKTIGEALSISAGEVIEKLKGLPDDHLHCSILAVSTLYRAIADHLLRT